MMKPVQRLAYHSNSFQQRGFALLLVLWILSLLTIMAGSFALTIRRESAIIAGLKDNAQATAVAESGIAIAQVMLLNNDKTKRWVANGSIYSLNDWQQLGVENAHVSLRIIDEKGKIDINKASQKLLASLMSFSPLTDERDQLRLVGAILDWRDQDDIPSNDGAEYEQYSQQGLNYGPRNKAFQSINELKLLIGMNDTVYNWLSPLVTVFSGQPKVDLRVATKDVLQVLPELDQSTINDFVMSRLENIKQGLPPPNLPLDATGSAPPSGEQQLGTVTIIAEAFIDEGGSAVIKAVLRPNGINQPFQIFDWQRNTLATDSLFGDQIGVSTLHELLVYE